MTGTLLVGRGARIERIGDGDWRAALAAVGGRMRTRLAFMTADHHAVREFVVRELPRAGQPLGASAVAAGTGLPIDRVEGILDELHRQLFFLVRRPDGAVAWAFPVTVDRTAHALTFDSGERLWGA